jgi:hypothetical protein
MAISEDVLDENVEVSPKAMLPQKDDLTLPSNPFEVEPLITLNSLTIFSAPQTLKLITYIKNRKVIILVNSGSTHNFIHHTLAKEINCYICDVNNFQVMIFNGDSMKCGGHCANGFLQIGECNQKYHMFSNDMRGYDNLFGVECLCTLGPITMDFKD